MVMYVGESIRDVSRVEYRGVYAAIAVMGNNTMLHNDAIVKTNNIYPPVIRLVRRESPRSPLNVSAHPFC